VVVDVFLEEEGWVSFSFRSGLRFSLGLSIRLSFRLSISKPLPDAVIARLMVGPVGWVVGRSVVRRAVVVDVFLEEGWVSLSLRSSLGLSFWLSVSIPLPDAMIARLIVGPVRWVVCRGVVVDDLLDEGWIGLRVGE
jgi:hypothetical protein